MSATARERVMVLRALHSLTRHRERVGFAELLRATSVDGVVLRSVGRIVAALVGSGCVSRDASGFRITTAGIGRMRSRYEYHR